jgi:DNA-directed RNA polymerase specialized sigma24 family protein
MRTHKPRRRIRRKHTLSVHDKQHVLRDAEGDPAVRCDTQVEARHQTALQQATEEDALGITKMMHAVLKRRHGAWLTYHDACDFEQEILIKVCRRCDLHGCTIKTMPRSYMWRAIHMAIVDVLRKRHGWNRNEKRYYLKDAVRIRPLLETRGQAYAPSDVEANYDFFDPTTKLVQDVRYRLPANPESAATTRDLYEFFVYRLTRRAEAGYVHPDTPVVFKMYVGKRMLLKDIGAVLGYTEARCAQIMRLARDELGAAYASQCSR